jgi:hypothetical protein
MAYIYQLRAQGGASEDFWPKATTSTFEKCVAAYVKQENEAAYDDDEMIPEDFMFPEPESETVIDIPNDQNHFIHKIKVD